jgi:hypothetical protein
MAAERAHSARGGTVAIRLTKSPPNRPKTPIITFAHQRDVQTLARLLAEHRGHHTARD